MELERSAALVAVGMVVLVVQLMALLEQPTPVVAEAAVGNKTLDRAALAALA